MYNRHPYGYIDSKTLLIMETLWCQRDHEDRMQRLEIAKYHRLGWHRNPSVTEITKPFVKIAGVRRFRQSRPTKKRRR